MKFLEEYDAFINEERVSKDLLQTNYHKKHLYVNAKVRNAIIDALRDGVITDAEMRKIIKEMGVGRNWFIRNKSFFDIAHEQGVMNIRLSPQALKMWRIAKGNHMIALRKKANRLDDKNLQDFYLELMDARKEVNDALRVKVMPSKDKREFKNMVDNIAALELQVINYQKERLNDPNRKPNEVKADLVDIKSKLKYAISNDKLKPAAKADLEKMLKDISKN